MANLFRVRVRPHDSTALTNRLGRGVAVALACIHLGFTACSGGGGGDGPSPVEKASSSVAGIHSSRQSSSSSSIPSMSGVQLFNLHGCAACHGDDGTATEQPIQFDNYTLTSLTNKITQDMPVGDPAACDEPCAQKIADHLWSVKPLPTCDEPETLPRRLRLLTKFEYINTVNDLFGAVNASLLAATVGSDTRVHGFDNNVQANKVTLGRMDGFWTSAQAVANSVSVVARLNACEGVQTAHCFVERFGRDAFRRPLTEAEVADYVDLFHAGATTREGARYVIQAMLISPHFLYRTELGVNGQLTQYEIASLLSYTFWGSMPDDDLFEKAANKQLSNAEQLKVAVQRMLDDDRARNLFTHFGRQWLNIEPIVTLARDTFRYPDFTWAVKVALDSELDLTLQELLLTDGYTMADFFINDFVMANQVLANFYGLDGVSGTAFRKVAANEERGGILFTGAVLARNAKFFESNPILRGLLVRRQLLCQEFAPPPNNVGLVRPFDPSLPTRERFAAHTENQTCVSCHQYIDEVGFAFEQYDAVGQFRTREFNGTLVDASGSISGLNIMTDPDVHSFNNLQDLAHQLATQGFSATSHCVAEQFHRMMDGVADPSACNVNNVVARWNPRLHSLRDLWIEMVASQVTLQRH